jgi:hypothetical protein
VARARKVRRKFHDLSRGTRKNKTVDGEQPHNGRHIALSPIYLVHLLLRFCSSHLLFSFLSFSEERKRRALCDWVKGRMGAEGRERRTGLRRFVAQLYILLWKNFLLKRRQWKATIGEIIMPLVIFTIVVW